MGVRDLSPLIRKLCPAAITPIPSIVQLANSSIAIDGTLFTTKIHHTKATPWPPSASPEQIEANKHVRAWYNFIRSLWKYNIKPIVVFDGPSRLEAKKEENERRAQRRELDRLRSEAENKRGVRLKGLASIFGAGVEGREGATQLPVEIMRILDLENRQRVEMWHREFRSETELLADSVRFTKRQLALRAEEAKWWDVAMSGGAKVREVTPLTDLLEMSDQVVEEVVEDRTNWELSDMMDQSLILMETHKKRSEGVPKYAFSDSMRLLRAMGVSTIQPLASDPHEAEGICSTLWKQGLVDYVVSEDTDVIVYGAPVLRFFSTSTFKFTSLSPSSRSRINRSMHVVQPEVVMSELRMSKEMFVDFCLLCGTDFTTRMWKCGPANALSLIRKYGSIESILTSQTKFIPSDPTSYLESIKVARKIFLDLPPLPSGWEAELNSSPREDDDLAYLLEEWGIWNGQKPKSTTSQDPPIRQRTVWLMREER